MNPKLLFVYETSQHRLQFVQHEAYILDIENYCISLLSKRIKKKKK